MPVQCGGHRSNYSPEISIAHITSTATASYTKTTTTSTTIPTINSTPSKTTTSTATTNTSITSTATAAAGGSGFSECGQVNLEIGSASASIGKHSGAKICPTRTNATAAACSRQL